MDLETKEQWKWKFYRLTLQLNAIVFLAAVIVLSFFLVPTAIRIPIILILLVIVIYLSITFLQKYKAAKDWLYQHSEGKKPE
jgi:uncharacterized membrane protein